MGLCVSHLRLAAPRIFEALLRGGRFSGSRDAYFVMTCGAEIGDPIPRLEAFAGTWASPTAAFCRLSCRRTTSPCSALPGRRRPTPSWQPRCRGWRRGGAHPPGRVPPPVRRGAIDKLKSGPVNAFFYRFIIKAGPFRSTSACVGCGKCAAVCVENNIRLRDGRPVWGPVHPLYGLHLRMSCRSH
ncbi:MAG: hypothetical protein ACLRIS_17675 [Flavonifractor plautii]